MDLGAGFNREPAERWASEAVHGVALRCDASGRVAQRGGALRCFHQLHRVGLLVLGPIFDSWIGSDG